MSGALCRRQKASFYNGLLCGLPTTSTGYFAQMHMAISEGHFSCAVFRLLSSPCIERPESTSLSMYLAISTSDLSAICNIKASVSVGLNGNKREASIND
ncbi:hypothetical protein PBY51_010434 [Eleginops maclovinus]|uniref:Uncharacterized protein n=1 Tax=Eleginops maclovinus TaxID=56733 RepID=A0AAN7XAJ2_ELEMC|nr:hypothetical protein PBY51_010434 [Eleginops maclovinus]